MMRHLRSGGLALKNRDSNLGKDSDHEYQKEKREHP